MTELFHVIIFTELLLNPTSEFKRVDNAILANVPSDASCFTLLEMAITDVIRKKSLSHPFPSPPSKTDSNLFNKMMIITAQNLSPPEVQRLRTIINDEKWESIHNLVRMYHDVKSSTKVASICSPLSTSKDRIERFIVFRKTFTKREALSLCPVSSSLMIGKRHSFHDFVLKDIEVNSRGAIKTIKKPIFLDSKIIFPPKPVLNLSLTWDNPPTRTNLQRGARTAFWNLDYVEAVKKAEDVIDVVDDANIADTCSEAFIRSITVGLDWVREHGPNIARKARRKQPSLYDLPSLAEKLGSAPSVSKKDEKEFSAKTVQGRPPTSATPKLSSEPAPLDAASSLIETVLLPLVYDIFKDKSEGAVRKYEVIQNQVVGTYLIKWIQSAGTGHSHFSPKPDQSVCLLRIGLILIEVVSNAGKTDCTRVLLEAIAFNRAFNTHKILIHYEDIDYAFNVAMYLDEDLSVTVYFCWSHPVTPLVMPAEDIPVYVHEETYNLEKGAIKFVKFLHDLKAFLDEHYSSTGIYEALQDLDKDIRTFSKVMQATTDMNSASKVRAEQSQQRKARSKEGQAEAQSSGAGLRGGSKDRRRGQPTAEAVSEEIE